MTRFLLHVGLHKTGTTYIQKRMEKNAGLFPPSHCIVKRNDLVLHALTRITHGLRDVADLEARKPLIHDLAKALAEHALAPNVLISHEDLLGALPTRFGMQGLYPFAEPFLRTIVKGIRSEGHEVELVVYLRGYNDWLRSLLTYKIKGKHGFALRTAKERFDLPPDLKELRRRLHRAAGEATLHLVAFETDRATGQHGKALFDLFGIADAIQQRFTPLDPVNVSRPETVDAKWMTSQD